MYSNSGLKFSDFFSFFNNYLLISLFNFIVELKYFIKLSPIEMKNADKIKFKDVISFISSLPGKLTFVSQYFLKEEDKNYDEHNIIKMILLKKIYFEYDRDTVLKILNESSEDNLEYAYIPVLVDNKFIYSKDNLIKSLEGIKDAEIIADYLEQYHKNSQKIDKSCIDSDINSLFCTPFISPIVDDFLRFHKENYSIDTDSINFIGVQPDKDSNNDDKNKKKQNTRSHIVISTY